MFSTAYSDGFAKPSTTTEDPGGSSGNANGSENAAVEFFVEATGTERRAFNESAIAYYGAISTTTSRQFNDLQRAAQKEEGFQGYWPGDRGN